MQSCSFNHHRNSVQTPILGLSSNWRIFSPEKWRYFRIQHWFCLLWHKWVWYYSHDYRPNWTPLSPITSTMTNCSRNHVITATNCSSFRFELMYVLNKNPNSTLKRRSRFILLIVCSMFTSPKTNKQNRKETEKKYKACWPRKEAQTSSWTDSDNSLTIPLLSSPQEKKQPPLSSFLVIVDTCPLGKGSTAILENLKKFVLLPFFHWPFSQKEKKKKEKTALKQHVTSFLSLLMTISKIRFSGPGCKFGSNFTIAIFSSETLVSIQ